VREGCVYNAAAGGGFGGGGFGGGVLAILVL